MYRILNKLLGIIDLQKLLTRNDKHLSFFYDFNRNLGYEFEKDANDAIKIIRKNTMLPYVNLVTLYEQVLFCEKNFLEGDYVECGVWKGGAVGLMALANMQQSKTRKNLHLFDAFDDICAPDEQIDGDIAIKEIKELLGKDANVKGELLPQKGIYAQFGGHGTIEECQLLIEKTIGYPADKVHYHKGWFQDTIPEKAKLIDKIAILRLDGDWYASTKICLEHLFDKVVPGGFIIVDDYGMYSGCKKAVDEYLKKFNIKYYLNYSTWSCRYFIK
jgi:O-methyltransferase